MTMMKQTTKQKLNEISKIIAFRRGKMFIEREDFIWQTKVIANKSGYVIHYETIKKWQSYIKSQILLNTDRVEVRKLLTDLA